MDDEQLALNFPPPRRALPQLWTPDDIFTNCDQQTIEQFGEDSRVERKLVEVQPRDLGDYLSMWSNTLPHGGVIFLGIGNDGTLKGCKSAHQKTINDLESARATYCPDARVELKRIPIKNDKGEDDFIIAVRVPYRADKLVETVSGTAFVREGEDKRRLSEAEKREIRINKGEVDFEIERSSLRFPEDFDQELISGYCRSFISKRSIALPMTAIQILTLSKLGKTEDGVFYPNVACALLFGKDPRQAIPGAFIRILRYEGSEEGFGQKLNSVSDKICEGPLPLQISQAEAALEAQMRNFTRLNKEGRFVTSPEYPKEVWLEAVVNAVVHRSYNLRNMNIYVKLFDDKMVVESPGTFMPPTTAETVYDAHNPRNPNLMWGMYFFDFVQCAFEGTRRMRSAMTEQGLPAPIFSERASGSFSVSVTLKNNIEHRKAYVREEAAPSIDPIVYSTLTDNERMIVNTLADKGTLNVTEAMDVLQLDWRKAKAVLDALETKLVVERTPGNERDRHRKYLLRKRMKRSSGPRF